MGLDIVELVVALEAEYRVEFPREELVRAVTVGLLFDVVARHSGIGEVGVHAGPAWERYCEIVSSETGVPITDLLPAHLWLDDLGLD